ncbi:MAG: hypothetical protein PWQ77_964 [Kosmotogales bacterium]|nr:hypothetical protein [Kosmotogales bacterium]
MNKFESALIELSRESPFYNFLLMFIEKYPSRRVTNISLKISPSGKIMLFYNPEKLKNRNLKYIVALIKHECLHVINGHILIKREKKKNKFLFDLCMDASINQYIRELDVFSRPLDQLLSEGCGVDNDTMFVTCPGNMINKTAEEYYDWAIKFLTDNKTIDLEIIEKDINRNDDHEDFGKYDLPEEFVNDLMKQVVAETYESTRSEIPEGLEHHIKMFIDKPVLDWKTQIRRFFGSSIRIGKYRTPLKPNRRYDDQPGWQSEYAAKVVVILDTSGSIIEDEFNSFFSEIDVISRISNSDIWLIQADETIQSVTKYSKGNWKDIKLFGTGNTDLQPAVEYAQKNLRPEGIVLFTDGFTDLPIIMRKTLFVLSKHSNKEFIDEVKTVYGKSSVVSIR